MPKMFRSQLCGSRFVRRKRHARDGLISDCGASSLSARKKRLVRHSTLKEPVSHRRKKTMGYELVEQLAGNIPLRFLSDGRRRWAYWNVEGVYRAGGTRLVRPGRRPRMIAVQSAGVRPSRALFRREKVSQMWQNAETFASGLSVPKPYGDYHAGNSKRIRGVALSFSRRTNSGIAERLGEDE